jgi:deazaflavin-dependent oxidoreductase (nitroreductase family)
VTDAVRKLARATRRLPLKSAGRSGAYASVVRHVGRTSGREYETPVHAVPAADGFAVALPYGSNSDWVKNVRARGTAVIIHDANEYRVDQPMLVPLEVAEDNFSPGDHRMPLSSARNRRRARLAHPEFSATLTTSVRGDDAMGHHPFEVDPHGRATPSHRA